METRALMIAAVVLIIIIVVFTAMCVALRRAGGKNPPSEYAMTVNPTAWGPPMWDSLYHVAAGFTPERKDAYKAYYGLVPYILRCDECNLNLQRVVAKRPVDAYLDSPASLLRWVHLTHMDVRQHQVVRAAPDFTLDDVYKRYLPPPASETTPTAVVVGGGQQGVFGPRPLQALRREGFASAPAPVGQPHQGGAVVRMNVFAAAPTAPNAGRRTGSCCK